MKPFTSTGGGTRGPLLLQLGGLALVAVFALTVFADASFQPIFLAGIAGTAVWTVVKGLAHRLELDAGGTLTHRRPPMSTTSVDLQRLRHAEVTERIVRRSSEAPGPRPRVQSWIEMELSDADGGRLHLRPRAWRRADLLVAAVEDAAARADIEVVGHELLGMRATGPGSDEDGAATERAMPWTEPPVPAPSTSADSRMADAGVEVDELSAANLPSTPARTGGVTLRPRAVFRVLPVLFALGAVLIGVPFVLLGRLFSGVVGGGGPISAPTLGGGLPLVLVGVFVLLGVLGAVSSLVAKLEVGTDGTLRVRPVPFWRQRTLRLGRLRRLDAHAGPILSNITLERRASALTLTDVNAERIKVIVDAWADAEPFLEVVASRARASGAVADDATRALLTTGTPPPPTGPRPRAPGS